DGPEDAIREGRELLPTAAREDIARDHLARAVVNGPVSAVVGGERRIYTITEATSSQGSAGMAVDVSEIDNLRREFERTMRSHANTLDQLTTAVAIFDAGQKLRFYNQAFQKLWDLDASFLDSAPENAIVLDRLRSE